MSMRFEVRVDDRDMAAFLARSAEPEVRKVLLKARSAAGRAGKPILKAATPQGPTGNLRSSVGYGRIKSNSAIGVVIAPMRKRGHYSKVTQRMMGQKLGWHRHFVEMGTKAHFPWDTNALNPRGPRRLGPLQIMRGGGAVPPNLVKIGGSYAAGFAIATSIARRGTKPHPFIGPSAPAVGRAAEAAAAKVIVEALSA